MSKVKATITEQNGAVLLKCQQPLLIANDKGMVGQTFLLAHEQINFGKALMTAGAAKVWELFIETWRTFPDPVAYVGYDGLCRILKNPADMPPAATSGGATPPHSGRSPTPDSSTSPSGPPLATGDQPASAITQNVATSSGPASGGETSTANSP
jgi:hypothetical protein